MWKVYNKSRLAQIKHCFAAIGNKNIMRKYPIPIIVRKCFLEYYKIDAAEILCTFSLM